ncbi:hypothetical protein SESBI_17984 [Sesbania bispinosa]|nr:hypothetical protein SESBI_17984 [Sesbania bispinosa]
MPLTVHIGEDAVSSSPHACRSAKGWSSTPACRSEKTTSSPADWRRRCLC